MLSGKLTTKAAHDRNTNISKEQLFSLKVLTTGMIGDIQGDPHEEDAERALISGCYFGDFDKVRRTILRNPWINLNNVRTESEKTLLMVAYTKGHANIVRLLLSEGGMDSTCRDWQGRAVLSIVNQLGVVSPDVLNILTESHCPINKQDADRLLEQACSVDDIFLVKPLLTSCRIRNSAFVTIRESFQKACRLDYVEIVAIMLAKPGLITSDVLNDRRNDLQRSVAFTSSLRMLSVLLTRHDLQLGLVDAQQQCPLHLACMTGRMDLVEVLLKRDITVLLIHDKNGANTPLHYACAQGHLEIVQFILEHPKMKPDYLKAMDDTGHTAFLTAITKGHLHMCSLLLSYVQQHADDLYCIVHDNCKQHSALSVAASKGYAPIVQTLLRAVAWSTHELAEAREEAALGNHKHVVNVMDAQSAVQNV